MGEKINFTKAALTDLLAHFEDRRLVRDSKQPGLIAELRSGDSLSFFLYKRIDGRPTKYRIGRFPDVTVEQARTEAQKLLGRVASGENPVAERRSARVEHTFARTLRLVGRKACAGPLAKLGARAKAVRQVSGTSSPAAVVEH